MCTYNSFHVLQLLLLDPLILPFPPLVLPPLVTRWIAQAGGRASLRQLRGGAIRDHAPGDSAREASLAVGPGSPVHWPAYQPTGTVVGNAADRGEGRGKFGEFDASGLLFGMPTDQLSSLAVASVLRSRFNIR